MANIYFLKWILSDIEEYIGERLSKFQSERNEELKERWKLTQEDIQNNSLFTRLFPTNNPFQETYLGSLFTNTIRKALFVSAYNAIEETLTWTCKRQEEIKNLNISVNDLSGNGIIRARKYLTKVACIKFPETEEWKEIQSYNKLRNCIVHNEGKIFNSSDKKFLAQYIESTPYLKNNLEQIVIERGFCENAFDIMENFSKQLEESTRI